jgi:hypothetical protein
LLVVALVTLWFVAETGVSKFWLLVRLNEQRGKTTHEREFKGGRTSGVNLQTESHAQYLQAGRISAHYLDVLGVRPVVGRNFSEVEDRAHGPKAAILSSGLWRNTFGSNPNLVGRAILLKGEPYTVIGVLPEGATTPQKADLYTAIQATRGDEGSLPYERALNTGLKIADGKEAGQMI